MPPIRALTHDFHVCQQIQSADLPEIARAGYAALICMRPDGESPDQPTCASIEASARDLGLAFHYLPVLSGAVTEQQAARLGQLLDRIKGPVLAYCASGNRCALAHDLSLKKTS